MPTVRAALLIATTDLRRRLRNRSFVLQAFVGPLLLATIISAAFGGGISFEVDVGIVDADRSEISTQIVAGLVDANIDGVDFVPVLDSDVARRSVSDGEHGAAVVVPAGFAESLSARSPRPIEVISDAGNPIGEAVAQSVAQEVAARSNAGRLAAAASVLTGGGPPDVDRLTGIELPIEVAIRSPGEEASPAAHFGPGMGLLFLFLTVGMVARGLIEERRRRVLDRIRAAPISMPAILLGKCAAVIVTSVASLTVIWMATTLLLGADWGDPVAVMALIVTSALAVAGVAGVVASVARSEQTADTLATMVAFGLSLIGGSMIPLADLPEGLRRISLLTPNGWSLRGFAELSAGSGTLADVTPHLVVLVGWGAVMGAVAAVVLPRRLGVR